MLEEIFFSNGCYDRYNFNTYREWGRLRTPSFLSTHVASHTHTCTIQMQSPVPVKELGKSSRLNPSGSMNQELPYAIEEHFPEVQHLMCWCYLWLTECHVLLVGLFGGCSFCGIWQIIYQFTEHAFRRRIKLKTWHLRPLSRPVSNFVG